MIGDFGRCSVYKAVLPTGQTVAVKRYSISSDALDGFKNEIFLGSSLHHRNIINPLGYCIHENGEAIVVYDYMAQDTLRSHLYKSRNSPLTWKQRLQICIDAAKGLEYLHTGSDYTIIHRDVTSSHILLDKKWRGKLCGFYASKALPSGESDISVSTMLQGTMGYLDPEYYLTGRVTKKSDVYSYGVVLLEVLCGRPAIDTRPVANQLLSAWATLCFKEGKLEEIIDSTLAGKVAPECFKIFAETAIACVNLKRIDRPVMRDIVRNLEFAMQLQEAYEGMAADDGDGLIASTQ